MGMFDLLAEAMVEEYEEKGKKLSFELARLIVQVETNDGLIKVMLHDPEYSMESMAAFLDVSVRFVEISIARYKRRKKEELESDVTVWEQVFEMRKRDDPKSDWTQERQERSEKDFSIRISEQIEAVKIFLASPDYPVEKIAELVGISVSSIELIKRSLLSRSM
jgi:hypothetical protein